MVAQARRHLSELEERGDVVERRRWNAPSGSGMAAGFTIGLAIGVALDEPVVGMAIGASMGAALEGGSAVSGSRRDDGDDADT